MKSKLLATLAISATTLLSAEEPATTFTDAWKNGNVKGTIGTYLENTDSDSGNDFGWQTGYLKLKYETLRWNKLKLGAEAIGHVKLWADDDDKYDKDMESDRYGLSELYLDYLLTEKTSLRFGRWSNKGTHIDDGQSQGIKLTINEIENVEIIIGAINKFAEMDYDDMETFGRDSDSQDLGDYEGADGFMVFAEAKWSNDNLSLNPYIYHQGDYATIVGMDTDVKFALTDNIDVGTKLFAYNSFAGDSLETPEEDSSFNFTLEPYIKTGAFTYSVGYNEMGDVEDINKPAWFKDYLLGFDQDKAYGEDNLSCTFGRIKYKSGNWKGLIQYGMYEYGENEDKEINEFEAKVGYKFDKESLFAGFDAELRFFDVDYNNAAGNKDYQKVEARIRYKF